MIPIDARTIKNIVSADMNQMDIVMFGTECKMCWTKCIDDIVWYFSFVLSVFDIGISGTIDDGRDCMSLEKNFTLTQVADIECFTISIDDGVSCVFKFVCHTKCRAKHSMCSRDENGVL
jgi:hypothetical protein